MQATHVTSGRKAIPNPTYRQSLKNWFLALAETDPRDVGGILEALGIVLLILSTRAPRGPEPALTTTRDKSRLWRRALRDFFNAEDLDDKGGEQ
jgi:hypothetical protein